MFFIKVSQRSLSSIRSTAMEHIISQLKGGARVAVLTGAGMSCSSGIPDFRSPGGMYDTLKPELITATAPQRSLMRMDPTTVVDIRLFAVNQFPYLEVRRPFILGTAQRKWKATLAHFFVRVLHDKDLLQRLYTQNIDGLDLQLDLPPEKVVNLHGSLAQIKCEFCGKEHSLEEFHKDVQSKIKNIYKDADEDDGSPAESSPILCVKCRRPGVKPATVLYGTDLPTEVWRSVKVDFPDSVDLLIIAGTSLTVSPANQLVTRVDDSVRRLVVNRDRVGEELGLDFESDTTTAAGSATSARDVLLQTDCDGGFLALATQLGWLDDLYVYKDKMCEASASLLEQAYSTREQKHA